MLEQLGIGERSFASSYRTEQNKTVRLLNLPKRECLILASGYSVEIRARITSARTGGQDVPGIPTNQVG